MRESVLWLLRRGLEGAASVQRGMVEKRIERVREKEKSVLYKAAAKSGSGTSAQAGFSERQSYNEKSPASLLTPDAVHLSEADTARIEAQLSPEQLQLFAEENDTMLRHYEDTLSKVQYVLSNLYWVCSMANSVLETPRSLLLRFRLCRVRSSPIFLLRRSISRSWSAMLIPLIRMLDAEIRSLSVRTSAGVRRRPCFGEPWACVLGLLCGIWSFKGIPLTLCQEHMSVSKYLGFSLPLGLMYRGINKGLHNTHTFTPCPTVGIYIAI